MKTKSIKSIAALTILAVLTTLTFSSCKKEKLDSGNSVQVNPALTKQAAKELSLSGPAYTEAQYLLALVPGMEKGKLPGHGQKGMKSGCMIITNDTSAKPKVCTFDFGSGCTCSDGITRQGQVVISYDSPNLMLINNTVNVSFNSFYSGPTQISGTFSLYNSGYNSNNNMNFVYTFNVSEDSVGNTYTTSGSLNYEWIAGKGTSNINNDLFSVTGSLSGNVYNGSAYTETVTTPLILSIAQTCPYVIQGDVDIQIAGSPEAVIDYGNGTCSGMESITSNGQTTVVHQ